MILHAVIFHSRLEMDLVALNKINISLLVS